MSKRLLQDVITKDWVRGTAPDEAGGEEVHEAQAARGSAFARRHNASAEGLTRIPPRTSVPRRPVTHHRPAGAGAPPPPPFVRAKRTSASQGGRGWLFASLLIGAAVVGLTYLAATFFSGATVTVYPKQKKNVFVDGTFVATRDPLPGELGYNSMTIERTLTRAVQAESREEAEEYATGKILIFNEYDENPQRLIARTRFRAPSGLIYRIREPVEVPGARFDSEGELVEPGRVEATVYADEPGADYNVDEARFTIPGFEGTSRFEKFYAKTKTPITGGFVGTRLAVSPEKEKEIRRELREKLIEELKKAAFSSSEKPEGYYLFNDAVFVDFRSLPSNSLDEETLEIREKGVLTAVLFKEDDFARLLAKNVIPGYNDLPLRLDNPDELAVRVEKKLNADGEWDNATYLVKVKGAVNFTWRYDPQQLKKDLAGREDKALSTILTGYPGIERAESVLRPFWSNTFPENPEEITINEILD